MGPSCHGTWSHISPSPTESLTSTPASAQKPQDRTQQVGQLSNPRRLTTDLALTPDHLVPPASLCKSPLPPLHPHLLTLIPSVAKPVALDWNLFPDLRISKEKHFWKANFWKAKGRPLSEGTGAGVRPQGTSQVEAATWEVPLSQMGGFLLPLPTLSLEVSPQPRRSRQTVAPAPPSGHLGNCIPRPWLPPGPRAGHQDN